MKRMLLSLLLLGCVVVCGGEISASRRAAALAFLKAKGTPQLLERNCRLMLEKQIAAVPEAAEHRAELEKFYLSTFGFEALKEALVELYAAEYTEEELKELAAFYASPLGRKSVAVEEKLVPAFAELLERRARECVTVGREK